MNSNWKKFAGAFVSIVFLGGILMSGGRAHANTGVTVDFGLTTTTAGNYVFGVSSWPRMDPAYAPLLADAGVTMIRQSSIGMAHIVPNTTIQDYLNNVNNVQDPSTWNWNPTGNIETLNETDVDAFNAAGIKVFSILAVTPPWLTYTPAYGTLPANWVVFEDIIKKIYQHYENKIAYFEIFNEPEIELSIAGSPYTDKYSAYRDLYYHSLNAINSLNPSNRRVGGPVMAFYNSHSWLANMLSDPQIRDSVDFASWHNYGSDATSDAGIDSWHAAASGNGKPDLPLFLSEYNIWEGDQNSTDAISYVGGRISALMDKGATGAFLYGTDDRASGWNAAVRHTWHIINQDGTLTPRMKPIRLLSKKLGLGIGQNRMKYTEKGSDVTWASAAINEDGYGVAWAVNDTASSVTTNVELKNLGLSGNVTLSHYLASAANDASTAYLTENKTVSGGSVNTTITIPPKSVYGIRIGTPVVSPNGENIWGKMSTDSSWGNSSPWELGTKFQSSVDGRVTDIRVYSLSQESGDHTARIWNNATNTVVGGPYTINYGGTQGWVTYKLPTPVDITAGTEYTVSVTTGTDGGKTMPITTAGATGAGSNRLHLTYPQNAGVNTTSIGTRPTSSSGYNYLRDVVFVPEELGPNIALGKTATASSVYGAGFEASKAVDGIYSAADASKAWASTAANTTGAWWQVDLGSPQQIAKIKVQYRGYGTPKQFRQVPESVTFQVSNNGSSWTTVISKSTNVPVEGSSYSDKLASYNLNANGRYVRLLFEDGSQGTYDELVEVEIYSPVNKALNKSASSSSTYSVEYGAGKAVDGIYSAMDTGNAWASTASNTIGAWWQVDMGYSQSIGTVNVQYRGYDSPKLFKQVPKNVTFQVSNNGSSWTTVVSKSTHVPLENASYSDVLYNYSLNATGRYIRLLFEDGTQGSYCELVEVEVY